MGSSGSSECNSDSSDQSDEFSLDEIGLSLDCDDEGELCRRLELGDLSDGVVGSGAASSSNKEASNLLSSPSSARKLILDWAGGDDSVTAVSK